MATEAQIPTGRLGARKPTGPRTAERVGCPPFQPHTLCLKLPADRPDYAKQTQFQPAQIASKSLMAKGLRQLDPIRRRCKTKPIVGAWGKELMPNRGPVEWWAQAAVRGRASQV